MHILMSIVERAVMGVVVLGVLCLIAVILIFDLDIEAPTY